MCLHIHIHALNIHSAYAYQILCHLICEMYLLRFAYEVYIFQHICIICSLKKIHVNTLFFVVSETFCGVGAFFTTLSLSGAGCNPFSINYMTYVLKGTINSHLSL